MALLFPWIGGVDVENIDIIVTTNLSSVLSRINMIISSLPIELQENMEEVKNNIISLLNDFHCDIKLYDKKEFISLDSVTLYSQLNYISNDLGICVLIVPNNVKLEDAVCNVSFVIKKLVEYDTLFRYCYDSVKSKVLK